MGRVKWIVCEGDLPESVCIARPDSRKPVVYTREENPSERLEQQLRCVKGLVADALEALEDSVSRGEPVEEAVAKSFAEEAKVFEIEHGSGIGLAEVRENAGLAGREDGGGRS